MNPQSLVSALKPGMKIKIRGQNFRILQHIVWWQVKQNKNYDKYVLEDEAGNKRYRFFIAGNFMALSFLFEYDFSEPMPEVLKYDGETYRMTQDEFCIARKTEGETIYQEGECEIWWDYENIKEDGSGLSLGRSWETWEREDLKTQEVLPEEVEILNTYTSSIK